ncbi:MAG: hypothetical protein AABZ55_06590, partial [Bdellovibrionota bacterium]
MENDSSLDRINTSTATPNTQTHIQNPTNLNLSPDQLTKMAGWLVEVGHSPEIVNKALAKDGIAPLEPTKNIHPIDQGFPPAKPEDFQMPLLVESGAEYTHTTHQFDKAARGWLSAAGFTKEIGSFIAQETSNVAGRYRQMSDLDRSLFAQDEEKGIRAVFGDKADQRIKLAQQLVQELEKQSPGLVAVLEETGA